MKAHDRAYLNGFKSAIRVLQTRLQREKCYDARWCGLDDALTALKCALKVKEHIRGDR